jgi:hypothetical protein
VQLRVDPGGIRSLDNMVQVYLRPHVAQRYPEAIRFRDEKHGIGLFYSRPIGWQSLRAAGASHHPHSYVENKTVGENLDQILRSDQIKRYKVLSNNILLTDYLQFIWIKDGKVNGRELIAFPDDLEGKPKRPREDRSKAVSDLLRGFFSIAPEGIGRAQQLALALATRSHFLRDFLDRELRRQEKEHREGRLYGLYQIFRDQVFHELALGEFADAFAVTIPTV